MSGRINQLFEQFLSLFRNDKLESDLGEEVASHIQMAVDDNVRAGMKPEEARRQAMIRFGGFEAAKELHRDARGLPLFESIAQDLRYAARTLLANPGFTAVAVLTLALGIGANTAIFGLVNAVLFQPLPFGDSDRLAVIWEDQSWAGVPRAAPSPGNFADWRAQNQVFEDVAAVVLPASFNLLGNGEPERIYGVSATGNLFTVLGVRPAAGRLLTEADDRLDASGVVVISERLWRRRFSASPDALGQTVRLNGVPRTIVGVAPAAFQFPDNRNDVWIPAQFGPAELAERTARYLFVVARLKPAVAFSRAQSDMSVLAKRLEQQYPQQNAKVGAAVVPLREEFVGDIRPTLRILFATAGMVLLIACVNLAHLLMARGSGRSRELALRAALGAGRFRVLRQLLTESALLAIVAAGVGGTLSLMSFPILVRLIPLRFPQETAPELGLPVLAFTVMVALVTIMVFGAGPAWSAARADLAEAMKQGRGSGGRSRSRMRSGLVVAEMALSAVLLIGAGLLLRSYEQLRAVDIGFRTANLLSADTVLSSADYVNPERRAAFYDRVLERLRTLPGVSAAAYVNYPPLTMKGGSNSFYIEGRPAPKPGQLPVQDANNRTASPGYLEAIGIPLVRGRLFDQRDSGGAQRVAVINETMARTFWPGNDPVGHRIAFLGPNGPWTTIIGVAGDVRQMGLDVPARAEMYFPLAQQRAGTHPFFWPQTLIVRTTGKPLQLAPVVRRVVAETDPNQPVSNIRTMEDIVDAELFNRETQMMLVVSFAALALILASVGLYGVLGYLVAQRTPEIGIRMALGAEPRDVLSGILRSGLLLTALGIVVGLAVSFGVSRVLTSVLYGVTATDPLTFAAVPVVLLAVAATASYVPARRATKVDPLIALRRE